MHFKANLETHKVFYRESRNKVATNNMLKIFQIWLVLVFLSMNSSLHAQDCYKKIEILLRDCRVPIHTLNFHHKRLVIETDSLHSINYSRIIIEPFDHILMDLDYSKIDSLLNRNYIGVEILSTVKSSETYGALYSYMFSDPDGNLYFDRYVIKRCGNMPFLIRYSSILGGNKENFERFELMLNRKD
ncbi:hypothetical protein EZJ43_05880 [Pedobacter changchengzhani]|uniref:Uncharacterized protein n=2 Tax=Pedobacter changchengzhani TaxID=2529274 RepID=A0A4R5MM64_9SPHI|nr:hypothetical protein EZJ43_05880 [Pedobacter changchengzhani]